MGVLYGVARWRHPVNTIETSMCGGDAALCQVSVTTYYYSVSVMESRRKGIDLSSLENG